jgi:transketolase
VPEDVPTLAVELGVPTGWYSINPKGKVDVYGLNRFGASGPGKKVAEKLGFSADALAEYIKNIVK